MQNKCCKGMPQGSFVQDEHSFEIDMSWIVRVRSHLAPCKPKTVSYPSSVPKQILQSRLSSIEIENRTGNLNLFIKNDA